MIPEITNIYFDGGEPETKIIEGVEFRNLIDLCFTYADQFSMHRGGWANARDSGLQEALEPCCLGEYRSYGHMQWFGHEVWEKCYLYPATEETKGIFLQYITRLFSSETVTPPEGHAEYMEKKYAAYQRAQQEADDRLCEFFDSAENISEDEFEAFDKENSQEARRLHAEIFDERDYFAFMQDPCFFRNGGLFFEAIDHELIGRYWVLSDEFDRKIHALGDCTDILQRIEPPLPLLQNEKGLILYRR